MKVTTLVTRWSESYMYYYNAIRSGSNLLHNYIIIRCIVLYCIELNCTVMRPKITNVQ